jgi:hypothetical protein
MPGLVQVARENDARAEVLLVSYDLVSDEDGRPDQVRERVAKFVGGRGWGLPVLVYDGPDLDALNERFALPGPIPVTLAFDAQGREVDREEDAASAERLAEMLATALGG